GLLLNPLTGWKKAGDFSEEAVRAGYRAMLAAYYPAAKVHFAELRTPMRYAGPREAVFHALVRRNLGCTHFIIGRDHAGVGDYYAQYAAHELAAKLQREGDGLGIELLLMREPYWCERCAQIVSDRTCNHYATHRVPVSATLIRQMLAQGKRPDPRFMRAEVADAIIALGDRMFIAKEETCNG
ncbi:MAG TPA: sulfate adenylyltransferase, partial [bacterium]|nr:sulfate adenylyltransferase [bacterium]